MLYLPERVAKCCILMIMVVSILGEISHEALVLSLHNIFLWEARGSYCESEICERQSEQEKRC